MKRCVVNGVLLTVVFFSLSCNPRIYGLRKLRPSPRQPQETIRPVDGRHTPGRKRIRRQPPVGIANRGSTSQVFTCGDPWVPLCTNQHVVDDPAILNPFCRAYSAVIKTYPGHKDWSMAQFTGAIGWLNYATDNDFNLMLIPDGGVGITGNNHLVKGVVTQETPSSPTPYIELEFDSDEVAPLFKTSRWVKFNDQANRFSNDGTVPLLNDSEGKSRVLPCGVVTGVFGLDAEHGGPARSAPLFMHWRSRRTTAPPTIPGPFSRGTGAMEAFAAGSTTNWHLAETSSGSFFRDQAANGRLRC